MAVTAEAVRVTHQAIEGLHQENISVLEWMNLLKKDLASVNEYCVEVVKRDVLNLLFTKY